MTSVNSPACLLARNNFYRNFPSSPESCGQDSSDRLRQRQFSLCISMATPTGFPLDIGTKLLSVNFILSAPHSHFSKPHSPSDPRQIK